MLALREGSQGLQGTSTLEHADEIEEFVIISSPYNALIQNHSRVIRRINRKVSEWASLSRLRSFLSQREMKDGIDCLHRDIDAAIMRFHVRTSLGFESPEPTVYIRYISVWDLQEIKSRAPPSALAIKLKSEIYYRKSCRTTTI